MHILISIFVALFIILRPNCSQAEDGTQLTSFVLMQQQNCYDCYDFTYVNTCTMLYRSCIDAYSGTDPILKDQNEKWMRKMINLLNDTTKLKPELKSSAHCMEFLENGIGGKPFCNLSLGSVKGIKYKFSPKIVEDVARDEVASGEETDGLNLQPEDVSEGEYMKSLLFSLPGDKLPDNVDDSDVEPRGGEKGNMLSESFHESGSEVRALPEDSMALSSKQRGSEHRSFLYSVWILRDPHKSWKKAQKAAIWKSIKIVIQNYGKNGVNFTPITIKYKKGYFVVTFRIESCDYC